MGKTKVAFTIEEKTLKQLDHLVRSRVFKNRSRAIQEALNEKLARLKRIRLAQECAKLDPELEQALAEEGMEVEIEQWPEY